VLVVVVKTSQQIQLWGTAGVRIISTNYPIRTYYMYVFAMHGIMDIPVHDLSTVDRNLCHLGQHPIYLRALAPKRSDICQNGRFVRMTHHKDEGWHKYIQFHIRSRNISGRFSEKPPLASLSSFRPHTEVNGRRRLTRRLRAGALSTRGQNGDSRRQQSHAHAPATIRLDQLRTGRLDRRPDCGQVVPVQV
jgi:hypothetical protein